MDHAPHLLTALDPSDRRQVDLRVAGPAALLVAKAIKLEERLADAARGNDRRLKEKDALDMFRLLQAVDTDALADGMRRHLADDHAAEVTARGLRVLTDHALTATSALPDLATRAAAGRPTVAPSFVVLTKDLLNALEE